MEAANHQQSSSMDSSSSRPVPPPPISDNEAMDVTDSVLHEFSLSGPVASEFEFFYALSVFTTRPHILNRNIKGAELVLEAELASEGQQPKFYTMKHNELCEVDDVPQDLIEGLKEPYLKSVIDELRDLGVHRFTLERHLIGHTLREYVCREIWDLEDCVVVIESQDLVPNKELPPLRFVCSLVKASVDDYVMKIEVHNRNRDTSSSRLMQQSIKFYKDKVIPKIIKWASSNNSFGQDGKYPNTAPGVPSTSLKYVPVKVYYEQYKGLKEAYFTKLQSLWTETTDPVKFISEEMGIATYIKTYISTNSSSPSFSFVDMGCGNGVLTFALTAYGATGFGFDIRSRKLWDVFPHVGVMTDLRVQSFNPFCDDIPPRENQWLIGNHADELTPWISVMARRFNTAGFIVIPCCLFDFHGKFQRKAKNSCDADSLYQNYIHYIAQVGERCGYSIRIDKLRIPSTKRICIIGTTLEPDCPENITALQLARDYAVSKVSEFPTTDNSISDIKVFKPRSPVEKINNLTQVDRTVVRRIVQRIFDSLLTSEEGIISHPTYAKPWNGGRRDFTLAEAALLLTREERDLIQNQGKGLQTLMKNHHQIFRIRNGCVHLRRPVIDDVTKKGAVVGGKNVKSYECFYNANHPDGCPLVDEVCRFKH
ncbi:putative tRNA (uracil-O(2)-)-methyltransferase [Folsomia candida]|uniref:tRNA (uracil-O(2)-)-methyltransferase n=1 Tax=Folsomia candida TaxID=158441 RepID=A0A226EZT5_FOLCA|nr:putative tRNA (uracil-O(2)-)-methyltransferase [Folsomia candida]